MHCPFLSKEIETGQKIKYIEENQCSVGKKQLKDAGGHVWGGQRGEQQVEATGHYNKAIPWYLVRSKPCGATAAATNVLTTDIMIIIIVNQADMEAGRQKRLPVEGCEKKNKGKDNKSAAASFQRQMKMFWKRMQAAAAAAGVEAGVQVGKLQHGESLEVHRCIPADKKYLIFLLRLGGCCCCLRLDLQREWALKSSAGCCKSCADRLQVANSLELPSRGVFFCKRVIAAQPHK